MSKTDVEKFWRRDRANLRHCKINLEGVVSHYENLRTRLAGSDN